MRDALIELRDELRMTSTLRAIRGEDVSDINKSIEKLDRIIERASHER